MLDTNMVFAAVGRPDGRVADRILHGPDDDLAISIVVAGELRYGVDRKRSARLTQRVERWLGIIPILPLEEGVDVHYAQVRTALERRGQTISGNDLFIAAHALALGATLVTDNVREFGRVEGLKIVNWLRD